MKRIKVAVLIDAWFPFYGGGQVHVKEITKNLQKQCEFEIFHSPSARPASRILWSARVIPQVIKDHKQKKFDLVHAHAFLAGIPGKAISRALNLPVVFTIHGSHILDIYQDIKIKKIFKPPKWKYFLEKMILTGLRYDYQISVAERFLSYDNVNQKIAVIANGVNVSDFDSVKTGKNKQFTIIFVGRQDKIKGISYLDSAFKKLKQKHPDIKLVKVSGGRAAGKQLIKLYKSSHLFVLPSLAEGQPISLLEAWAAKLPVIVTRVGDNAKMVEEGINGYLVPPADESELYQAMLKAYENSALEELGQAGYNLVKKSYTWKQAARKTLKVYKEVLNGT